MSFIREVISTANETEMLYIPKKMSEIKYAVSQLRKTVKDFMETKYLTLLQGNPDEKSALVDRATEVTQNIKELQARLDHQIQSESANTLEELKLMTESLTQARLMTNTIEKIMNVDKEIEIALSNQKSRDYYSAAQHIEKAQQLVEQDSADLEFLTLYSSLVNKVTINYGLCSSESLKMWKAEVSWIVCHLDPTSKFTTLQVNKSKDLLENLMKTLNIFGLSEAQIYYFSQSFNTEVLMRCIDSKLSLNTQIKGNHITLTISSPSNERPDVAELLNNLTHVFEFLHRHMDLVIDESRNFIGELGHHLADKFLPHLVMESLSHAIPTKREDLPSYEKLVDKIREFNALLGKIKFLPEGNDHLEKFCGNVEEQFLNKTIERYLSRARELSLSNLHERVPLTPPESSGTNKRQNGVDEFSNNNRQSVDHAKGKKESPIQFSELPNDFVQFPACHVSKSVLELMNLIREILDTCVAVDHPIPNTALKLFSTARDCINLYVDLTPIFHVKLLESLPQQSALFHNNCFYIAHELITLNEPYRSKYNDQLVRVMGTVVDMVSYVRAQGLKVLEFQISKQNDIILDIITRSGLSSLTDVDIPPMLEKSLRQCVHQLTFLQSMWQEVLPMNVYNKTMGQLSNSFLEEVIGGVCMTKDIKEATATHLVQLFGHILEILPTLFEEPKEVHRHVKKWLKFSELIHVLNGSLAQIGDRWADGKGPLALEFSAEHVRQLIKALFQVSDRRAAVISRIK